MLEDGLKRDVLDISDNQPQISFTDDNQPLEVLVTVGRWA